MRAGGWVYPGLPALPLPRRSSLGDEMMVERPPTRVVIDCDTGVDDAMAILYGLLPPEIEVVGLTCCWGNLWVETATLNTLRLLQIADRPDIPAALGPPKPPLGPAWRHSPGSHAP